MRIFVTGATGVVGRRAVPMPIAAGHEVTAVGRNPEKRRQLVRAGAKAVALDLFAPEQVRSEIAGYNVVVSLATHIPRGMRVFLAGVWRENRRLRRIASAILSKAGRASRFIQESFAPIDPDRGDRWIDESVALEPAWSAPESARHP